MAKPAIEVKV